MDLAFQTRYLMIGEHFNGLRTMKKIYMIVAALSVVFAAVSCNKEDVTAGSGEPMIVKFTAKAADVKAQFNPTSYKNGAAVPVLWNGGEKLSIAVTDKDARDFARDCAEVVASEDKKSAVWEYDFSGLATEKYTPAAPYTFHVFCGAARAYRTDNQSKVLLNNIPSEQTPGVNSCDPKAIYLYSKSGEYETWPSEVVMDSFEHLTAYGCITLGTGIPEEEKVQSVTITADAATNLSGATWYFYKTGNKYANYTGSTSPKSNPSITLKPAEGGVLPRTNLWFGCRPTTKLASLRFTVTTDKGVYEVVKSELDGRNFQAGKVAKMKINDFGAEINEVTYEFTANDLNGFIGGIYGGETLSKTAVSGAYPSLNWSSVATLIEGKESIKAEAATAKDGVTRVKFNAGFDNFVFTITPEEGWIVESFNLNSKRSANEVYKLHATIGGEDLAIALNKSVGTSDTPYKRDNANNVAGPLSFTYTREPAEGSTGDGVFYINSLKVVLKKQELQQEETPETPEE